MRSRPGTATRLALTLLAVTVVAGCTSGGPERPDGGSDDGPPTVAGTVTVERGDITTVLTLDAQVAARPTAVLIAPAAGTVREVSAGHVELATEQEGITVEVPAGAEVTEWLVEPGDTVVRNLPLGRLRLDGFGLTATLDPLVLHRFYSAPVGARAQIIDGPGPFDCALASPLPAHGGPSAEAPEPEDAPEEGTGAPTGVVCVIPEEIEVFAGLPALLAISMERLEDVLYLPVEAVAGSRQQGTVTMAAEDGAPGREVTVALGATDGARIEILDGLDEGDEVLAVGPDLIGRDPNATEAGHP